MKRVDLREALKVEIAHARSLVEGKRPWNDDSIHAARQALKRARAALRLLRDAVPDAAYRRENAALRDAARPFAPARDAAVMLELVADLMASRKLRRYRPALMRLRARLRVRHTRRLIAARREPVLRRVRALLEQALERTAHWRLPRDPRPVYRRGLQRVYAKGRRELHAALVRGSARALHEWRKQVKYFGAALELLEPGKNAAAIAAAGEIARRLGQDHDLAMLDAELRRLGEPALRARLKQKRGKLQTRAIKLARRLYQRPADRLAVRLPRT